MSGHKSLKTTAVIKHLSELPEDIQELCAESVKARLNAYAPYSKFMVGAALRTKDGIISGCNVENAALPQGVCAEVTAVTKAVSQGCREFSSVAIAADVKEGFCAPCGTCRQVMCEFNPDVPIYLIRNHDNMVQVTNLDDLLPQCFTPKRIQITFAQ